MIQLSAIAAKQPTAGDYSFLFGISIASISLQFTLFCFLGINLLMKSRSPGKQRGHGALDAGAPADGAESERKRCQRSGHPHSSEIFKDRHWRTGPNSIILSEWQVTHHTVQYGSVLWWCAALLCQPCSSALLTLAVAYKHKGADFLFNLVIYAFQCWVQQVHLSLCHEKDCLLWVHTYIHTFKLLFLLPLPRMYVFTPDRLIMWKWN